MLLLKDSARQPRFTCLVTSAKLNEVFDVWNEPVQVRVRGAELEVREETSLERQDKYDAMIQLCIYASSHVCKGKCWM